MTIIKAIIWDLDDTLWEGALLEGAVSLREAAKDIIVDSDAKGVLNCIASRNTREHALQKLDELGLRDFFVLSEIGWDAKSESVRRILSVLNIAPDAVAFVDNDPFERAEVGSAHPVTVLDARSDADLQFLRDRIRDLETSPQSAQRRLQVVQAEQRDRAERDHCGPAISFLRGLNLRLVIRRCDRGEIERVRELAVRTNQLNLTGIAYEMPELVRLLHEPNFVILLAELTDRFGSYGVVGSVLLERDVVGFHVRSMFVSCRVMSRGVAGILLSVVAAAAKQEGVGLTARFRETGRNEPMMTALQFWGFRRLEGGAPDVMACDLASVLPVPDYFQVEVLGEARAFLSTARAIQHTGDSYV